MEDALLRFDSDKAKSALLDILKTLQDVENATRLQEARDSSGNDMLKVMQNVFPLVTQIQMDVIQKYGFPGDGDGASQFLQLVRAIEKEDEEVARLGAQVRSYFLPPMAPPSHEYPLQE